MKLVFAAFSSAFLFGIGLGISGMTLPTKIIGFLDVFGKWDPSLIAVMFGAILVHSVSYRLITKRESPILVPEFQIPTRRAIDKKLLLGAAVFGAGWGLGGFCPGPALVGFVTGKPPVIIFAFSMAIGIYLYPIISNFQLQKRR